MLSLGALVLLGIVIFYSIQPMVITLAAVIIVVLLFEMRKKEKFSAGSANDEGLTTNTDLTGITRAFWGPLMPIMSNEMKEQTYYTMHSLPWASPPLEPIQGRSKIILDVPYEFNKI